MRGVALLALLALAGCGSREPAAAPQASETAPATAASSPPMTPPTLTPLPPPTQDLSALESRDCRTVAQAYVNALARGDFAFAARVWDDPVIDDARLKALFAGYKQPSIAISDVGQEGAAGSLYCTVSGTLSDAGGAAKPAQKGEIVLKRVNDVPGATPEQLRWTIRSSTFVEETQRTR
jgi:predicted small lipoprotein YifL